MKNTLSTLIALAAVACATSASAVTHLSAEQALSRLRTDNTARRFMAPRHDLRLVKSPSNLYIYSSEEGFMVLPAIEEAPALLAYSDQGAYEGNMNPNLKYWIDFYNRQLQYAATHPEATAGTVSGISRTYRPEIAPLTKTEWNQDAPYNDRCPSLSGTRCPTGCVATAMAQIMRYYEYPAKGTGSFSYYWTTGAQTLSFNFGNTTFDYSDMPLVYNAYSTDEQNAAVASLMYACGVSVSMDYTAQESGAVSRDMGTAFINYFNYDKSLSMPERDYYGLDEWEGMVYDELAAGRPVLYSGVGTAGGHQFICDGYQSDGYFHFNWGWGGMSNGYFLLTALNPSSLGIGGGAGGFNTDQSIVLNLKPEAGGTYTYSMYCMGNFQPYYTGADAGEQTAVTGTFSNASFANMPSDAVLGLKIVSDSNSSTQYVSGSSVAGMQPDYGTQGYYATWPQLVDGTYTVSPAFSTGGQWYDIPAKLDNERTFKATVNNGSAEFSSPAAVKLEATDVALASQLYIDKNFKLTYTLANLSDQEYIAQIQPVLFSADGSTLMATAAAAPVDIEGNNTEAQDYVGVFAAAVNSSGTQLDLTPGTYQLKLRNQNTNTYISEAINVDLQATPSATTINVTDFTMPQGATYSLDNSVTFNFTVSCTEGYFSDQVMLYIFPASGGSDVYAQGSGALFLSAGEEKSVSIKADLSELSAGRYMGVVYNGNTQMTSPVIFNLDSATGACNLTQSSADAPTYNLQGLHLTKITPGTPYIRAGRKVIQLP